MNNINIIKLRLRFKKTILHFLIHNILKCRIHINYVSTSTENSWFLFQITLNKTNVSAWLLEGGGGEGWGLSHKSNRGDHRKF